MTRYEALNAAFDCAKKTRRSVNIILMDGEHFWSSGLRGVITDLFPEAQIVAVQHADEMFTLEVLDAEWGAGRRLPI